MIFVLSRFCIHYQPSLLLKYMVLSRQIV